MSERIITKAVSAALRAHLNPHNDTRIYLAKEVTFDYGSWNMCRVDWVQFKPVNNTVSGIEQGKVICYQIKTSKADFHSKNGHNFLGDYNYYVMPDYVYEEVKSEIPYKIGVMTVSLHCGTKRVCRTVKPASRRDRSKSLQECLFMMLRSAARDNVEQMKDTNEVAEELFGALSEGGQEDDREDEVNAEQMETISNEEEVGQMAGEEDHQAL